MKRRPILFLLVLVGATLGTLQFIRLNNDHLECGEKVESLKNAKGEMIVGRQHVCKEAFPL